MSGWRIASGKTHVIFLAVPNTALSGQSAPGGAIAWKTDLKGSPALRGFKFPSGYTVEFVYPKAEAAALAKSNQGNVLAVDPDSEGKPELRKMSSEDMQMVHLWMLSLIKTGADNKTPAIEARAYQPPRSATACSGCCKHRTGFAFGRRLNSRQHNSRCAPPGTQAASSDRSPATHSEFASFARPRCDALLARGYAASLRSR